MANYDEIAHAIGANKKSEQQLQDWFGKVVSTSPFVVAPLGSTEGVECSHLCAASVNDYVYVIRRADGRDVAIGRVGGLGGEVYGKLVRKSETVDLTLNNNGLSTYWNPVAYQISDKNDLAMGYLQWYAHNSGYTFVALDARNNTGDTHVTNQLQLRVNKDGTRVVNVSETKPWRVGLGVTPTVLYNSSSQNGTTGTVTLSQSAANFDHMRIYCRQTDDDARDSLEVYSPNGRRVQLNVDETSGANAWVIGRQVLISGTSITTYGGNWYGMSTANGSYTFSNSNTIAITRVEAWNS